MNATNWESPFLGLKQRFRSLYEGNEPLLHSVMLMPHHGVSESAAIVDVLEPSFQGHGLIQSISTPTEGCRHHAHYFFGSRTILRQMSSALRGIRSWINALPEGLIPELQIPKLEDQTSEELVYWANLVYLVAFEVDAPYLQATVEYQQEFDCLGFSPWDMCPQPADCDPRPLMFHQRTTPVSFDAWKSQFDADGLRLPDVIDGYLCGDQIVGDFLAASLAAIDVLIYMLPRIAKEQSGQRSKKRIPRNRSKQSEKEKERQRDVDGLRGLFARVHNPNSPSCRRSPLSQREIAEEMGWRSKTGRLLQSRVNRRMTQLFGPCPMEKYAGMFAQGRIIRGFIKRGPDGGYSYEGVTYDEEVDLD